MTPRGVRRVKQVLRYDECEVVARIRLAVKKLGCGQVPRNPVALGQGPVGDLADHGLDKPGTAHAQQRTGPALPR